MEKVLLSESNFCRHRQVVKLSRVFFMGDGKQLVALLIAYYYQLLLFSTFIVCFMHGAASFPSEVPKIMTRTVYTEDLLVILGTRSTRTLEEG